MLDPSQQTSIPLIYLNNDPDPKFILNPKALQIIQSYSTKDNSISFISICGDYRSGKSFLMNSLFFSKEGFKVSPTTQPCTKGINMWSKPISANGKNVWILDTQGFGATDRDEEHDVKIFLLTTLISSIVMYNSFGALDENTINKLAGICFKAQQMDPTLGRMKMFWVLRDFSLKMENKEGRHLTPDEYLNQALDDSTSNKQQRTAIKKVFTQLHCIALVRPVIDQTALSQLNQIKFQQLRGQFVQQIYKLRKRMLSVVQNKSIQGMGVGGGNLGMFLGKYVEMLNNNQIETNVTATWEKIVTYQRQKFISQIMDKTRLLINSKLEVMPMTSEEIQGVNQQLNSLVESQLAMFKNHFRDQSIIKQTQNQLINYKHELIDNLRIKNGQRIVSDRKLALKGIFDSIERSMGKEFAGDAQAATKYIEKMFKTKDQYFNKFGKFISEPSTIGEGGSSKSINNKIPQSISPKSTSTHHIPTTTKLMYYQQFYTQQKHLLPKVIGQFSQQMASTMIKLNEQKKLSKRYETQIKQLKQENHLLNEQTRKLTDKLSSSQRSLNQLQKLYDIKQHQIQTITTQSQNQYLQLKAQYQENIEQLKETILSLEKNFMSLKKQTQLQKTQHNDKLKYLNQRHQMTINKLQQSQLMSQKILQQVKEQYQEKLKRAEDKYQQVQTQLLSERKKFLQLNKSKKQEESELLEDLAEKNQKLLNLRREFVNVQHSYKQQLEMILKQQKSILTNEFTLQLQEKHHRLMVYQQKLQQCLVRIAELQQVDRKYENLLIQHKLSQQEHQVLAVKYSQVVNKLKKSGELQKERDTLFEAMKDKYLQQISRKEELLKKFKLQLKTSEEEHTEIINKLESQYEQQITNIKEQLQRKHEQRITTKINSLETAHKQQRNQLHQQLKQLFQEVQQLKLSKGKLTNEQMFIVELIKRLIGEYEMAQKQVKIVMKKYKKLQLLDDNNTILQSNNSHLQSSQLDIYTLSSTQPLATTSTLRQQSQHLQSLITPLFLQWRSQTQNLQDLKHSFKQTITQLQQCQTHIHSLNAQISNQEVTIRGLQTQLTDYKQKKHKFSEVEVRLEEVEKENELLKNEVKVRDEIFSKRQVSIKENLQLYKETIANLTQENQHLSEKATKLQLELNRFTDWQGDFLLPNNTNNTNNYYYTNKPPSSTNSLQYLNQNQQADDNQFTLSQKLQQLQKQNRKLKKQLDHQQQLLTLQQSKHPSSILSTVLLDNNHKQIIQALKKENLIYKQRVEQLRERQLKLIEQVKLVKQNQKSASQNRVNREREEFQLYRKKVKEQMIELEKRIQELSEEKYRLKQEMLVMRQQHRQNQDNRNYISSANNLNRYDKYYNQSNKQNTDHVYQRQKYPKSQKPTLQSLQQAITSLKHQNLKLQSQLTSINQQLLKTKDQADKKLASMQVLHEQKIRQLQSQKARVQLDNEKNKTKYQHLLKVNNELIVEVENFKARATNQMTLKEKYKHKITALFMDE